MAISREELNRLRKLARARHRAATSKISRSKKRNNVLITGTEFDPRRDLKKVDRYTAKQLTEYIGKLDTFTSRKVQFERDRMRRPIPKKDWTEYKRLESSLRDQAVLQFEPFKSIVMPNGDMTLEMVDYVMGVPAKIGQEFGDRPGTMPNLVPKQIHSLDGLRKLSANIRKKLQPDYSDKKRERLREVADKMLEMMGDDKARERVRALGDRQADALLRYSSFMSALGIKYMGMQMMLTKGDGWWSRMASDNSEIEELLSWAERL